MDEKINELLGEELKRQIESLSSLETGTREMGTAVDDVTKLYKLLIDTEKVSAESRKLDIEENKNKNDSANMLNEQKKDRYVKIGIAAAEIVIPFILYGMLMRKGLKFEETGCVTSPWTKNLINRITPKK